MGSQDVTHREADSPEAAVFELTAEAESRKFLLTGIVSDLLLLFNCLVESDSL